jgi:hypothetical protein
MVPEGDNRRRLGGIPAEENPLGWGTSQSGRSDLAGGRNLGVEKEKRLKTAKMPLSAFNNL